MKRKRCRRQRQKKLLKTQFSLLIAAPLLAGVQNFPGVTQHLRTDGTDSFVGLIVLVLLTSALVDH